MPFIRQDIEEYKRIRSTGSCLRLFRKSNRIQAQVLARVSGISHTRLCDIEQGRTRLSKKMAIRLVQGYKSLNIFALWIEEIALPPKKRICFLDTLPPHLVTRRRKQGRQAAKT